MLVPFNWIDVKTKLPENRQIVLTLDEYGDMAVCECQIYLGANEYIFMLHNTSHQTLNVTHWADLPAPPSKGNSE